MNLRRKRMILMRDVWYGYNRTASGNPVKLEAAKRLRQLTIYGNAVQDGTPSPDAPVEVQLCGDATGNLLSSEWEQGNINIDVGINTPSSIRIRTIDYIKCEPNTAYTFYSPYYTTGVRYYNDDKEYMDYDFIQGSTLLNFTTPESTKYLRFIVENSPIPDVTLPYMLFKGSYTAETMPDYEPYGYKINGEVVGENLFDVNDQRAGNFAGTVDDDDWITITYDNSASTNNSFRRAYTDVSNNIKPSTAYKIVTEIQSIPTGCSIYAVSNDTGDGQFINTIIYSETGIYTAGITSVSNFANAITMLRTFCAYPPGTSGTFKFRISVLPMEADTANFVYQPYNLQRFNVYTPYQIGKVDSAVDEIVLDKENKTAELVQRTKEIVFDGTENWMASVNVSNIREFKLYIDSIFRSNYVNCFSNRYKVTYGSLDHCTYMAGNNPVLLHIADNSFTTAAEFKAWLSELYASGEPLKYLFELATPVTTDITAMQDWDAMPQVKGTVMLTLSAEVPPSGAEAIYYSKERSTE